MTAPRFLAVALVLVAGLLVGGGVPVRAVTPVSYEDPAGDQVDLRPSMDILKVSWDVEQATAGGPWLVVEMTLAAPPEAQLVNYTANGTASTGCYAKASYRPGSVFTAVAATATAEFAFGCLEGIKRVDAGIEVKDAVITMSLPIESIPKSIRASGELTELTATTEIAEPLSGIIGTAWWGVAAADEATTDQTFRYA